MLKIRSEENAIFFFLPTRDVPVELDGVGEGAVAVGDDVVVDAEALAEEGLVAELVSAGLILEGYKGLAVVLHSACSSTTTTTTATYWSCPGTPGATWRRTWTGRGPAAAPPSPSSAPAWSWCWTAASGPASGSAGTCPARGAPA